MPNTGFKQATIAYKVSRPGGIPLDLNGRPISETGRKQAIALLIGHTNPNTALYEVERYFSPSSAITGNPTTIYDVTTCPVGFIVALPSSLILSPVTTTGTITFFSLNAWSLISGPSGIVTLSATSGPAGGQLITVTRTSTLGQGAFIFRDNVTLQTVTVYIINTADPNAWVLATGTWDNTGFWFNNSLWP